MTGTSEREIQARCLLAAGQIPGVRLFRNTVGTGWQGDVLRKTGDTVTLSRPRFVTFGLIPGSSDLIGWHTDGRFLSVECKTASGRLEKNQMTWRDNVRAAGGIWIEARGPDDLFSVLR